MTLDGSMEPAEVTPASASSAPSVPTPPPGPMSQSPVLDPGVVAAGDQATLLTRVRVPRVPAAPGLRLEVRTAVVGWRYQIHDDGRGATASARRAPSPLETWGWRPTRGCARRAGVRALRRVGRGVEVQGA